MTGGGIITDAGSEAMTTETLIDCQLEAYNRHDLEAFLAFYAEDVRFYDPPDTLSAQGIAAARERYERRFAETPHVRAVIEKRIVQGAYVIDQELLTGWTRGGTLRAVVMYEVRNGKICAAWFLK